MARPLTKQKESGETYTRPPEIESKINFALCQDLPTLLSRAAVSDSASGDYLPSECLVHLIRDARRRNNDNIVNALIPCLLSRCEKILLAKIPDDRFTNAAELREEVIGQFSELFAVDSSNEDTHELDFFECKFNAAFRTLRIDNVRAEAVRANREVHLPDPSAEESSTPQNAELDRLLKAKVTQRDTSDSHAQLYEGIDALSADERKAVILHYWMNYDIESEDPKKATVATICGVTGRTIRNRLSRANKILSRYLEEA